MPHPRRARICCGCRRRRGRRRSTRTAPSRARPKQLRLRGRAARSCPRRTDWCRFEGLLLPEVAAQFQRISDADCSPRVDADGSVQFRPTDESSRRVPPETRTRPQQQHDALATALFVAASSELLPTIGGAAPTLVVSARAEDVDRGHRLGAGRRLRRARRHRRGTARRLRRGDPCGCCSTRTTAGSSRSEPKNGSSTAASAARSPSVTAAASSPAAGSPPRGARSTTSSNTPRAARPIPTTACCSAGSTIGSSTVNGWEIRMNHGVPEVRAPLWFDSAPPMAGRHEIQTPTARPRRTAVLSVYLAGRSRALTTLST